MFRIAICDDNEKDRKYIRLMLENKADGYGTFQIHEYNSGRSLLEDINQNHNLIFLDIYMKGLDGNETAKLLRKVNETAVLAFCSGVAEPISEYFKVRPFRYIKKNMPSDTLNRDIDDLLAEMRRNTKQGFIMAHSGVEILKVKVDNILYISKRKRGSDIFISEQLQFKKEKDLYSKLHIKDLYIQLKEFGFEFAHDSYIVNMNHICSIKNDIIVLSNGQDLKIARSRIFGFKKALSCYLGFKY